MTNGVQNTTSITTPSDTVIRLERDFDAPRELVWEAYTEPELLSQWLGPHGTELKVKQLDLRVGGSYRWTTPMGDGQIEFWGEYREVSPPSVLESTFEFSGAAGHVAVDRLELQEIEGGRTRLVATSTYANKEDRDAALQSGMEKGIVEGYEKLDAVLERLGNR
ncbi:MAG TPA: SRPBCC family protein [Thermoleophilaceae bacterium]|nr:SRPBCC family protein [Thermoleophilaceae bacterium]